MCPRQVFSERHENAADAIGLRSGTALDDDDEPFDLGFGNSVFSPGQSFDVDSVSFKGVNAISSKVDYKHYLYAYINKKIWYKYIRLETKSCRILPLTYGTKYDMT